MHFELYPLLDKESYYRTVYGKPAEYIESLPPKKRDTMTASYEAYVTGYNTLYANIATSLVTQRPATPSPAFMGGVFCLALLISVVLYLAFKERK